MLLKLDSRRIAISWSKICVQSSSDLDCGLYYKSFTIVIYNCNDSGQYYETIIMIVIDDPS